MNVKTNVYRLPDAELIQLGISIVAGATGKAELASSPVTVAEMQTAVNDATAARTAETAAEDDLNVKRTDRQEKLDLLRDLVRRFAQHANAVYAGDKMSLQALGFDVRKTPTPVGPLPAPQNLRTTPSEHEGAIEVDWEPTPKGRPQYFLQCAPAASGPWTDVYTGRATATSCGNLTPGTEYFFRVKANGKAGDSPWSDISKRRAP